MFFSIGNYSESFIVIKVNAHLFFLKTFSNFAIFELQIKKKQQKKIFSISMAHHLGHIYTKNVAVLLKFKGNWCLSFIW